MANVKIISITLNQDLGAGFPVGTKITTYWNTSASTYVVEKDIPSVTYGSNIATEGDSGDFEAAVGTWGSIGSNLTRQSGTVYSGTYSAQFTQPDTTTRLIATQSATLEQGKTYRVSCYVYFPSGNPIATDTRCIVRLASTNTSLIATTNEVNYNISDNEDVWIEVSIEVTVIGADNVYQFDLKRFGGGSTSGIATGVCYLDEFYVEEITNNAVTNSTITTGPDLGNLVASQLSGYADVNSKWATSTYSFCQSTSLVQFRTILFNPPFPYAQQVITPDSPSCVIPGGGTETLTCDLAFSGQPTLVKPSNQYSSDGEISVTANGSGGAPRYSLNDDLYADMTNSTGSFTGLSQGTYTIYARDFKNCRATITVSLPAEEVVIPQPTDPEPTKGVLYRMEHENMTGVGQYTTERIDILDRNFSGDYTEVKGGNPPFVRTLAGVSIVDKFKTIRPTFATIRLASERDLQFIGLFSQDDRKYKVNYYYPVGTLVWSGFITPSIFSEPYTEAAPYITEITVTDNLQQLSDIPFLDKDENRYKGKVSVIELIATILTNKIGLGLSIRVACNITEDTQTENRPLEETFVEMSSYYEDSGEPWTCERVLTAVLKPFGAKLVQEEGYWNIIRIEEQTASYDYVIYNKLGVYVSTGTKDPILEISDPSLRLNSIFRDRDHVLSVVPAYGTFTLKHNLYPRYNLIENGSFDLDKFKDGLIEGWTVSASTASYKVTKVITGIITGYSPPQLVGYGTDEEGGPEVPIYRSEPIVKSTITSEESALEVSGLLSTQVVDVVSKTFPIEYSDVDSFIFSFSYQINTTDLNGSGFGTAPWIRIEYRLKLGDYYYNRQIGWTDDSDYQWNQEYAEKYNEFVNVQIKDAFDIQATKTISTFTVTIRLIGANYPDYTDYISSNPDGIQSIVTTAFQEGYRIRGIRSAGIITVDGAVATIANYVLRYGTDSASYPDIIRPTDYNAVTNAKVWVLESYKRSGEYADVLQTYIDNVTLQFLPNSEEPPVEILTETINNKNYRENIIIDIEGGDVYEENLNNKGNLYKGIFYDQVGQPTNLWTRDGIGGTNNLKNLLLSSYVSQYRFPTFKISGTLFGFDTVNFLTTFKQSIEQPIFSLTNPGFTTNITGWSNSPVGGPLTDWAYGSSSARVTLTGAVDSKILKQTVNLSLTSGQRIRIDFDIQRQATSGTRNDWLQVVLIGSGGEELQVVTVAELLSDNQITRFVRFNVVSDSVNIGFRIKNVEGSGSAQYDMYSFNLTGQEVVRYFTPDSMVIDSYNNSISVDLLQLIPVVPANDLDIDDSGENNTGTEGGGGGGVGGGGSYTGGDFNSDFNSDFYI